mmetsp:Transcript_36401/g.86784  ORF Transcript_36401/g.86784 Transcript_36401/m.86784 type:complete len:854 (+) Transcript_36401:212-2773(+)
MEVKMEGINNGATSSTVDALLPSFPDPEPLGPPGLGVPDPHANGEPGAGGGGAPPPPEFDHGPPDGEVPHPHPEGVVPMAVDQGHHHHHHPDAIQAEDIPRLAGGSDLSRNWSERLSELAEYRRVNGTWPNQKSSALGRWLNTQKGQYQRGALSEDRAARLREIEGFDFGRKNVDWSERYAQLRQFHAEHGHSNVTNSHETLGTWVATQRYQYAKRELKDERIHALNELQFDFKPNPTPPSFNERCEQLLSYREQHGTWPPLSAGSLGRWLGDQRRKARRGLITADRGARFAEMGVPLPDVETRDAQASAAASGSPRKQPADIKTWDERYEMLREYVEKEGNANVPKSHPELGRWVKKNRANYQSKNLAQAKIDKLNAVNFQWRLRDSYQTGVWSQRYEELKNYHKANGNCNISTNKKGLGYWIKEQRKRFRKGKMPEEQVDLLRQIDFNFGMSQQDMNQKWEARFQELVAARQPDGSFNIEPKSELWWWITYEKRLYSEGKLSEEKTQRFEDVGFVLGKGKTAWEIRYKELVRYRNEVGTANVNVNEGTLGRWVQTQRQLHRQGKLTDDRAALLEGIDGFEWSLRLLDLGKTEGLDDDADDGGDPSQRKKRRRDPNAPKHNLSAFLIFSNANRARAKMEHIDLSYNEITKLLAEEFKGIPPEERAKWDMQARQDRDRFEREMRDYIPVADFGDDAGDLADNDEGGARKKVKKDPNEPRYFASAFLLYSDATREKVHADNPSLSYHDVTSLLSSNFKEISIEERAHWDNLAAEDRARYDREMAEFRAYEPEPIGVPDPHGQEAPPEGGVVAQPLDIPVVDVAEVVQERVNVPPAIEEHRAYEDGGDPSVHAQV